MRVKVKQVKVVQGIATDVVVAEGVVATVKAMGAPMN